MAFGSVRHSNIAADTKEIRLSNNLMRKTKEVDVTQIVGGYE